MPHHHYVPLAASTTYPAGLPGLEKCLGNLQLQVRELDTTLNEIAVHKEPSFITYHLLPTNLSFFRSFPFHASSHPMLFLIAYVPTFLSTFSCCCPAGSLLPLLFVPSHFILSFNDTSARLSLYFYFAQHRVLSSLFISFPSFSSTSSRHHADE